MGLCFKNDMASLAITSMYPEEQYGATLDFLTSRIILQGGMPMSMLVKLIAAHVDCSIKNPAPESSFIENCASHGFLWDGKATILAFTLPEPDGHRTVTATV